MIIIAEKINGSIPSVAKAIEAKDADFIRNLAKVQSESGADFIDVCASVEVSRELETLKWLIDLAQEVTDTPLAVDSPSAETCAKAIDFCKKPGLVNSVSMEGNKIEVVFPKIANTKWECVALLCDDTGIPRSAEKRLEVLEALMKKGFSSALILMEAGIYSLPKRSSTFSGRWDPISRWFSMIARRTRQGTWMRKPPWNCRCGGQGNAATSGGGWVTGGRPCSVSSRGVCIRI